MAVVAPPPRRSPSQPDAGVVADARRRQRRRRGALLEIALAAAIVVVLLLASNGGGSPAAQRGRAAAVAAQRCPRASLGVVAFVAGGALDVVDLRDCRTRTLVRSGAAGPVTFSADRRYVAFRGGWVAAAGGPAHPASGTPSFSADGRLVAFGRTLEMLPGGAAEQLPGTFLAWARQGERMVVQVGGRLELRAADGSLRPLTPPGWSGSAAVFAPDGRSVAVTRGQGRLWMIDVATGARRLLYTEPPKGAGPFYAPSFSPDGRWLVFAVDPFASASISADGVPYSAVATAGGRAMTIATIRGASVGWCGSSLVYVIPHGGRITTDGDGIAMTAPPSWRSTTVLAAAGRTSFSAFACRPPAAGPPILALAGGPSTDSGRFGHEDRSLWIAPARPGSSARRLAASVPPASRTDELPMWSANGRWLLFVRTRPAGAFGHGSLYAIDVATGRLDGPIAQVGATSNYYGSYGWAQQIAWAR